MAIYAKVNPDDSIDDVIDSDTNPGQGYHELMPDEIDLIKHTKFGHCVFDFDINNGLILSQSRYDALMLDWDSREIERELFKTSSMHAFVNLLISEINILRSAAGLPNRTWEQFKTAIKNELNT